MTTAELMVVPGASGGRSNTASKVSAFDDCAESLTAGAAIFAVRSTHPKGTVYVKPNFGHFKTCSERGPQLTLPADLWGLGC